MNDLVHSFSTRFVLVLCSLLVFPTGSYAQEETQVIANESQEVDSATLQNPYPLEQLLGDEVIGDFVLGPGKVELELAPGESKTIEISVSNRIGTRHKFSLEVEDMVGSNDPERSVVLLGDDTGPYTLKDYISIPQMQFELDHNMRARIPVTISVPEDAEPGGHYGSVLVQTVTREATGGSQDTSTVPSSAIVSRIGALFFVTVPGEVQTGGLLKDFSINSEKKWFESGPIDFVVTYENTGSMHLNPYGEIRITNLFGEEVGFVELEPWFTLPQSIRLREITWNREALYGRYTATVLLNRGYDDIVDKKTITFWVVPWKIVVGVLVGLFIVFFIIRSFFRKFEFRRKEI